MKATDNPDIWKTKGGIFALIICSTMGLVTFGYLIVSGKSVGFFSLMMLFQCYTLYKAIRDVYNELHINTSGMAMRAKGDLWVSRWGLISMTMVHTIMLCFFLPILGDSIAVGQGWRIAAALFTLAISGWGLVSTLRKVSKYMYRRTTTYSYKRL